MTDRELDAWQQSQIRDTWRVFRIMAEFVEGFEALSRLGPCVSVFGSARTRPGTPYYELGRDVGRQLVEHGYGVITGGGPGIMEAANQGAREAEGVSVGLNIVIPHEQDANPYVDRDKLINFDFFFVRKVMFVKYAQGFIVLPGGYGTLDELFESLTLIQTGKAMRFPVVLMGTSFWGGDGRLVRGGRARGRQHLAGRPRPVQPDRRPRRGGGDHRPLLQGARALAELLARTSGRGRCAASPTGATLQGISEAASRGGPPRRQRLQRAAWPLLETAPDSGTILLGFKNLAPPSDAATTSEIRSAQAKPGRP